MVQLGSGWANEKESVRVLITLSNAYNSVLFSSMEPFVEFLIFSVNGTTSTANLCVNFL